MPRNRLPRVMKHYSPTGRRNHGILLERLLDTRDRNGSTSGPTPRQIYDDDEKSVSVSRRHRTSYIVQRPRAYLDAGPIRANEYLQVPSIFRIASQIPSCN
jgi:hypothetical protein